MVNWANAAYKLDETPVRREHRAFSIAKDRAVLRIATIKGQIFWI